MRYNNENFRNPEVEAAINEYKGLVEDYVPNADLLDEGAYGDRLSTAYSNLVEKVGSDEAAKIDAELRQKEQK